MQHHIVQYQVFDVAFTNTSRSYELQSKISDVFHNQLMDGMEQLFSRLVPDDTVLSLGEVNIDVGNIEYNLIEYDLVDRVLAELEREIRSRLALRPSKNDTDENTQQLKKVGAGYTDLLEYFLLTGAIPWWASGDLLTDPLAIMQRLISADAAALRQLIIKVGQHAYVRQRLVQQFPEQVIRNIITILEPGEAVFIFDYHASVTQVHKQDKLIEGAINTEFEKALWLFILTYILVDRGSLFNQKIFVRSTLVQLAHHYNRSYAQILALLSKALTSYNLTDVQNNNLGLIINELSADEFDNRPVPRLNITDGSGAAEEQVQQNIELVKYYLVFGSFPWWSEPHEQNGLATILLGLIKTVPKALTRLIVSIGQNEEVRKRIATVFNDEVITAVIKLIEPANAAFIINYVAEVQVIHQKRPVANTDGNDFKKAVWKFILDYLLVERGSVFNERMFLDSNIRKLAANYNVQYADMLLYLVQSIGQVRQASVEHAPLFQLLAGLLNDFQQQSPAYFERTDQYNKVYDAQYLVYHDGGSVYDKRSGKLITDAQTRRSVILKDVLLHWLNYGNIPWWGSQYFKHGPAAMFEQLFKTSPTDALMLLKYAGTMPNLRLRVIYQLPQQLVVQLLATQPGGERAAKLYQYLLQAFARVNATGTPLSINQMLLSVFWEVYTTGQYKRFDSTAFLQKSISTLMGQHHVEQHTIVTALKGILTEAGENIFIKNLAAISISPDSTSIFDQSFTADVDIQQILTNYLTTKAPGKQAVINEVQSILMYFLNNGTLPSQFKGTNPAYIKAILSQLLLLLKRLDAKAYKKLLTDNLKLEKYTDATVSSTQIEGSIEQLISDNLLRDKQPQTDDIISEALTILEYFLKSGKFPKAFAGANTSQILKQLLLLLNYARPTALANMLQHDGYLIASRMQLHDLFALTTNTAENNVARLLKSHIDQDTLQYIKQQTANGSAADDTLKAMLNRYLNLSVGNQVIQLLKSPAAARYIARHYTDAQVATLLNNNTTLIGGTENLEWLTGLQLLIATNVTDTLQRDRLATLLREFNLLVLGDHIVIGSFGAYLQQLLSFISSVNYSLFILLSNIMLKTGSTPGLPAAFTAKLADVLTQLNIHKADNKASQQIKQLLAKADDAGLQNAAGLSPAKKAIDAKQLKEEIKQTQQLTDDAAKQDTKELLVNSEDTIYINNAGLVLLNPFLATFFVRLGMMEGGQFINTDMQLRAVHLLQYLVNGTSNSAEHFLVLNKVFCNVPVEEPVQAEITLTGLERSTSEGLLNAVLQSWDKLKNTSIAGLQQSFLQRDGALVFKDDAWHLKVEQRGYDVLLQTLPWTIGMIKTPWMDKFLYVEWA